MRIDWFVMFQFESHLDSAQKPQKTRDVSGSSCEKFMCVSSFYEQFNPRETLSTSIANCVHYHTIPMVLYGGAVKTLAIVHIGAEPSFG